MGESRKRHFWRRIDWSARGRARVYALTAAGTLFCIAVAFAYDSFSFETETWRLGNNPLNNVVIPLLLAPPFFLLLLSKMRQLAVAHHELMHIAATDPLTNCLNRRAFTALVDAYLEKLEKGEREAEGALLVLDVDHFKKVNDRHGHDIGDEVLKLVARTVRAGVRDIDLVGRMGGEEFAIFLPGLDPPRTGLVADRIRRSVSGSRYRSGDVSVGVTVSIGGISFAGPTNFAELYRAADQRLYVAKHGGRDRVVLGDPPAGVAERRAAMH